MKALITGAAGFLGSHIADFLVGKKMDVYAAVHTKKNTKNLQHLGKKIKIIEIDINDKQSVEKIVRGVRPDYIFHMAAQAYVIPSWENAEATLKTNIIGTLYLLDAVRKAKINPVIVVASSSAGYGLTRKEEIPISETKEFRPSSPYAVSKIGTDMISYLYARAYGMKIVRARLFNTVGPRKIGSSIADFAKMIAQIENGSIKKMGVGDLGVTVDFTDGRDAVRALWTLSQKGKYGEAYNICSGRGYNLEAVLKKMISYSDNKITFYTDARKKRLIDDRVFIGDNSKLRALGWKPIIPLEKTLKDTLAYWRAQGRKNNI